VIPAILNTWFAGSEAGVQCDVLFGNENGKIDDYFSKKCGKYLFITVIKIQETTGNQKEKFEKFKSNYIDEK
jgi:hypothetical protein